MNLEDVKTHYDEVRSDVKGRMKDFQSLKDASELRLFRELVFVILSSQTDAEEAWEAALKLEEMNLLQGGDSAEILEVLENYDIQYERNKADQIVETRKELSQPTLSNPTNELNISDRVPFKDSEKARDWLADNIPGIGMKGASHFLRNIGYGEDLGIASRHTLSMLSELGKLEDASPPSNKPDYREIEESMRELGKGIGLSAGAVDLVLWSMKTGKVFR